MISLLGITFVRFTQDIFSDHSYSVLLFGSSCFATVEGFPLDFTLLWRDNHQLVQTFTPCSGVRNHVFTV